MRILKRIAVVLIFAVGVLLFIDAPRMAQRYGASAEAIAAAVCECLLGLTVCWLSLCVADLIRDCERLNEIRRELDSIERPRREFVFGDEQEGE